MTQKKSPATKSSVARSNTSRPRPDAKPAGARKPRATGSKTPRVSASAEAARRAAAKKSSDAPKRTRVKKEEPILAATGKRPRLKSKTGSMASRRLVPRVEKAPSERAIERREARAKRAADKAHAAAVPTEAEIQHVRHVGIDANSDGQRIDNFLLKNLPGVPKSHVYQLVRSGQVRVDGGRIKADHRLVAGQQVRIPPVRIKDPTEARIPDRLANALRELVIHEDDHYLAINKPHGLSAHSGSGVPFGVIEVARAWGKHTFLELCHRLDRDTSGVILLAKSRPALLRAQKAFKYSEAEKRYFALLTGKWKGEDRDVDDSLVRARLPNGESYTRVDEDGKPSKSRFSPKARFKDLSLMEVQIFSGRTHQIRVHALALGHPVAGDDKYGEREINKPLRERGLKRMFLHSHFLGLPANENFAKLLINAPLPDELRDFLTVA